ncbi:hypothetical protein FRX31_009754 [Thalictrum thalictroides]|uniref:Uncharacterized protein n=1 Tax=Thalictrum thalictroides TaxID=46969 RepID=A0A7J6WTG3_THATH|nr:hypothetical protein FRX31_009754 [Thalictrum thalictroides]
MMTLAEEWSTTIVNEIGIICRKHVPLSFRDWRIVPRGTKDAMHGFLLKNPTTQAELGVIEMYRVTHLSDKREAMIKIQSGPTALIDGVVPTEEAIKSIG